jgi:uncharacterized protein (DUF2132 family)
MPVKPILKYLRDIESAFNKLESCYIERYEEETLTPDRVNIRIRARFSNGYILEWNESVITEGENINHLGYRYHFQDKDNKILYLLYKYQAKYVIDGNEKSMSKLFTPLLICLLNSLLSLNP